MVGELLGHLAIRVRLTLAFAAVMAVLFGGLALLLHERFAASLDDGIDRALHTRSADLATLLSRESANRVGTYPALPESGGAFAQLLSAQGRIVDSTPGHGAEPLLTGAEIRRSLRSQLVINRRAGARVLAQSLGARRRLVLVVGASLAQRDRALRALSEMLFIGGPVLLVLTCIAGYLLAAGALAPVERMRSRAARISGVRRGDRLPVPAPRDELQRLGATLNEMLARLDDFVTREKTFIANAGHELRTPLSILKLELELALSDDPSREELQAGVRAAAEEVDRLTRLANDLLVIASADQGRFTVDQSPLDVQRLLDTIADRVAGAALTQGRRVSSERIGRVRVSADPERIEQALANMVANALRYGAGPVLLTAREQNGQVELHVLDEGEGFAPEFLPRAFERFSRADPARAHGGTGLGLSIVYAIAEAHGGDAGAMNRETGGADVWISLPRA
jgi:two-component system, OmpR family, sensor kinase